MEERVVKMIFGKSGSGHVSPRITISKKWAEALELSSDEREVKMILDEEGKKITIEKLKK